MDIRTLFVASSNPGKLKDFEIAAETHGVSILPLPGIQTIPPPDETEPTFAGNARLKALFYSRQASGVPVLADDSGLEVDALGGLPGVHSARYASLYAPVEFAPNLPVDERNNAFLLHRLLRVGPEHRLGRYRCVLSLARDGVLVEQGEGAIEGEILAAPQGTGGFGYDPIFYIGSEGCSMADLDLARKQHISHRGRALLQLLGRLGVSTTGGPARQ